MMKLEAVEAYIKLDRKGKRFKLQRGVKQGDLLLCLNLFESVL